MPKPWFLTTREGLQARLDLADAMAHAAWRWAMLGADEGIRLFTRQVAQFAAMDALLAEVVDA